MALPTDSGALNSSLLEPAEPTTPPQSIGREPQQLHRSELSTTPHRAATTSSTGSPNPPTNAPSISGTESDLSSPPNSTPRCSQSSRSSSSRSTKFTSSLSPTQTPPSIVSLGRTAVVRPQPRIIRTPDGTVFEAWPAADRPDAPTLGDEPKRNPDGSIIPRTKREAEEQLEVQWQKRRKLTVEDKIFNRLESSVYGAPKSDVEGNFYFDGESLPDWLHAEREYQDDGTPGTFIVRPGPEDFKDRWTEILSILEPFGMRLGVIKLRIPEECLSKAIPYTEYLAAVCPTKSPEIPLAQPLPAPRKRGRPPKTYRSRKTSLSTESINPGSPYPTGPPDFGAPAVDPTKPSPLEPMVYTMTQFLPLHLNSKHRHAPIYEVISKRKTLVPISKFPHQFDDTSCTHRIPENIMLMRGRSWHDIAAHENPGGEVYYSSDNDATDELRSYLGLADPKLAELRGNHMFDSTETVIGIHTPYLYLGNPYTLFALHQEDYCALSLNFHHKGGPKMWRVTCPLDYEKVERLVARTGDILPSEKTCSQHVRHSSVFLSRGAMELEGIRSILVRQHMGEMVITWPLSYHEGWNEGANVCEAIAYGSDKWRDTFVDHGEKVYRVCGRKCVSRGMGVPIELKFKATEEE